MTWSTTSRCCWSAPGRSMTEVAVQPAPDARLPGYAARPAAATHRNRSPPAAPAVRRLAAAPLAGRAGRGRHAGHGGDDRCRHGGAAPARAGPGAGGLPDRPGRAGRHGAARRRCWTRRPASVATCSAGSRTCWSRTRRAAGPRTQPCGRWPPWPTTRGWRWGPTWRPSGTWRGSGARSTRSRRSPRSAPAGRRRSAAAGQGSSSTRSGQRSTRLQADLDARRRRGPGRPAPGGDDAAVGLRADRGRPAGPAGRARGRRCAGW